MQTLMPLVRSASLSGYVHLAQSLGLNPQAMMRKVGLSPRCLKDPETLVSEAVVRKLLEHSAQTAGVEDFGLRLAQGRRLSNLGPISIVLREEPTARQALDTLVRYLRLLNAALLTQIEDHADVVLIREDVLAHDTTPIRQSIEMAVGIMYRILLELLGPNWKPRRVCFCHRAPRDPSPHRAYFGLAPEFNSSFNGIVCGAKDLNARLPPLDSGLSGFARRFLDHAMSSSRVDAAETASKLIAALLPGGRCTADQVAQHMGMDRRTLHRHLLRTGKSFSSLLCAVRREFAVRQILDGDRSLSDMAELLGFSGSSALAYWFRENFGCTISQWRKANQPPSAV